MKTLEELEREAYAAGCTREAKLLAAVIDFVGKLNAHDCEECNLTFVTRDFLKEVTACAQ